MSVLVVGLWSAVAGISVFVIVLIVCHDPYAADVAPLRKAIKAERKAGK